MTVFYLTDHLVCRVHKGFYGAICDNNNDFLILAHTYKL